MVQNIVFGMRNMPNIVIRNIEAVIQESIRKVTAWASHGGGEERWVGGASKRPHYPTYLGDLAEFKYQYKYIAMFSNNENLLHFL